MNCPQVAMFQIMPALCPHGLGEGGGQPKCGQAWAGGGGVPKILKFVRTSFMVDPLGNCGGDSLIHAVLITTQFAFFDLVTELAS